MERPITYYCGSSQCRTCFQEWTRSSPITFNFANACVRFLPPYCHIAVASLSVHLCLEGSFTQGWPHYWHYSVQSRCLFLLLLFSLIIRRCFAFSLSSCLFSFRSRIKLYYIIALYYQLKSPFMHQLIPVIPISPLTLVLVHVRVHWWIEHVEIK